MKLNHEFIIKFYDHHFEDNGRRLCIVMELADRGTFTKRVTRSSEARISLVQGVEHLEMSRPPGGCPGLPAHSA